MTKKLGFTLTAVTLVIGLTLFSISNAFALDGDGQDTAPLTSAKQLCKAAKANYNQEIKDIKAKGLSLQMTKEQLDAELNGIKEYKAQVCQEAATTKKTCDNQYKQNITWAKAKGLSLQLSKEEVDQLVQEAKQEQKICNGDPLTSPVELCKEATKNYNKNIKDTKAKGLSLQTTKEQLANDLKFIKDYKKLVCKEAKQTK